MPRLEAMIVASLLSAIHLTLALGAGAIFARGRALRRPLDEDGWTRLPAADDMWGMVAVLRMASGVRACFLRWQGTRFPGQPMPAPQSIRVATD